MIKASMRAGKGIFSRALAIVSRRLVGMISGWKVVIATYIEGKSKDMMENRSRTSRIQEAG
ncbi:hypothetical protein D1872_340830 [compost metagenome]